MLGGGTMTSTCFQGAREGFKVVGSHLSAAFWAEFRGTADFSILCLI